MPVIDHDLTLVAREPQPCTQGACDPSAAEKDNVGLAFLPDGCHFPDQFRRKGDRASPPTIGGVQSAVPPPSTTSAAPVMNEESSEARNRTALAISATVPTRPSGRCAHPAI